MTHKKQSLIKALKERLARTEDVIEIIQWNRVTSYYYRRHPDQYKRELHQSVAEAKRLKIAIDTLER